MYSVNGLIHVPLSEFNCGSRRERERESVVCGVCVCVCVCERERESVVCVCVCVCACVIEREMCVVGEPQRSGCVCVWCVGVVRDTERGCSVCVCVCVVCVCVCVCERHRE